MVLTGIVGSSKFETAARTSGYGDSLDLVISRLAGDQSGRRFVLDLFFLFVVLELGGGVVLGRTEVRVSIGLGSGII